MKIGQLRRRLSKIYSRIPSLECREGCGECCGIHSWSFAEWLVITHWLGKHGMKELKAKSLLDPCPYLNESKKCTIYEVRPAICRLYGVVESLRCPYRQAEKYLKDEEATAILKELDNLSVEIHHNLLGQKRKAPSRLSSLVKVRLDSFRL